MRADAAASKLEVGPAAKNIAAIIAIEHDALKARTLGERLGDAVAGAAGRLWFILLHAAVIGFWMAANSGGILGLGVFDPFPYPVLALVLSIEATFLSLFILMSQNRAGRQAESRAHLDLQINLLAEQEATKMLQMLQALCRKHGLPEALDAEANELARPTEPQDLLEELKGSLPENC